MLCLELFVLDLIGKNGFVFDVFVQGDSVCGAKGCHSRVGLSPLEVLFCWQERGEQQRSLVTCVLCESDAERMRRAKRNKEDEERERKEEKRKRKEEKKRSKKEKKMQKKRQREEQAKDLW
jgi:hypothetical protein